MRKEAASLKLAQTVAELVAENKRLLVWGISDRLV
jgi:hypothetical protein